MRARIALSLAFAALILGTGFDARADGDPEAAKKHFEAGRKLRAQDDCSNAIPEFEKSIAADKSIGAFYNLGYCQEQLGHRQEAYDAYRRARDMASAKKDDRLKEISGALATLMETPYIRLVLPQPLPPGFALTVDGEPVAPNLLETETILFTKSTATHDVKASAPSYDDTLLSVETKQLKQVEMKKVGSTSMVPPTAPIKKEEPHAPFYRQSWFGIGLGVAGLAALTTGLILIVKYNVDLDKYQQRVDDALRNCGGGTPITSDKCLKEGQDPQRANFISRAQDYNRRDDQGRDAVPLMIGLVAAGGALLAGSAYILITADSAEKAAKTGSIKPAKPRELAFPTFAPIVGPNVKGAAMTLSF